MDCRSIAGPPPAVAWQLTCAQFCSCLERDAVSVTARGFEKYIAWVKEANATIILPTNHIYYLPLFLQEAIHTRLWFCRKLYIIVATLVLMVVGYQYQDYNKINFDMLRSMQLQITEIKQWQEKINSLKAITNGESPAHQSLLPGAR